MAKQIVGLDKAKAFWGRAKNGILNLYRLYDYKRDALDNILDGEKVVKVYLLVEDK